MSEFTTIRELKAEIEKLQHVLVYIRDIRKIECMHNHPGPYKNCARCMIDDALSPAGGNQDDSAALATEETEGGE